MKMRSVLVIPLALGLLAVFNAHASCGSTACSVNTNWDEHSPSRPGFSFDLRYSEVKLDQLRSGSSKITPENPITAPMGSEVENLYTRTRIVTASLDYATDEKIGMSIQLPYVMRTHKHTIADPVQPTVESFSAKSMGDIRLVGRYRLVSAEDDSFGLKMGAKLATGNRKVANDQGVVPGEVSLQPGNGSTDLIFGAFWQRGIHGEAVSYFAQAMMQTSMKHLNEFKPGNQINLDAGLRYSLNSSASALLQINYQNNAQDSGLSAAAGASGIPGTSTGGRFLYLTPGLSFAVIRGTNLYGMLQLPLYQNVNGEQLTASKSFTLGMNHRF